MTDRLYKDPDIGKSTKQLLAERTQRIQAASELKQPDRIPIILGMSYMLSNMYRISHQEQQENQEKEHELLEKAATYFQPDVIYGLTHNESAASLALGDRTTRFPGHNGLRANGSFQFLEGEYMKAEDYDAFIEDPADWSIRKYWPRVFTELEGLAMMPPLGMAAKGYFGLMNLGFLKTPDVTRALRALANAIDAQATYDSFVVESSRRLATLGFAPSPMAGPVIEAPFDFIGDTLRGMRGIMLDIYRRPEKLLAAQEKALHIELEHAISFCRAKNIKVAFIPLHRGSDGFMTLSQFETFYWPPLEDLILGLINTDITPYIYYEGIWDERLKYLTKLPKGKTVGWFQSSDPFRTKEIVGDTMCIIGGMYNSLLESGSPEDVRQFTIELCQKLGKGGGFIMSTTVGEMENCKPDLVKIWIDTTKEYGVYV